MDAAGSCGSSGHGSPQRSALGGGVEHDNRYGRKARARTWRPHCRPVLAASISQAATTGSPAEAAGVVVQHRTSLARLADGRRPRRGVAPVRQFVTSPRPAWPARRPSRIAVRLAVSEDHVLQAVDLRFDARENHADQRPPVHVGEHPRSICSSNGCSREASLPASSQWGSGRGRLEPEARRETNLPLTVGIHATIIDAHASVREPAHGFGGNGRRDARRLQRKLRVGGAESESGADVQRRQRFARLLRRIRVRLHRCRRTDQAGQRRSARGKLRLGLVRTERFHPLLLHGVHHGWPELPYRHPGRQLGCLLVHGLRRTTWGHGHMRSPGEGKQRPSAVLLPRPRVLRTGPVPVCNGRGRGLLHRRGRGNQVRGRSLTPPTSPDS